MPPTFYLLSSTVAASLPPASSILPPPLISLSSSLLPPDSRRLVLLPRCGNRDHDDDGTRATSLSSSVCATVHIRNTFLPSNRTLTRCESWLVRCTHAFDLFFFLVSMSETSFHRRGPSRDVCLTTIAPQSAERRFIWYLVVSRPPDRPSGAGR